MYKKLVRAILNMADEQGFNEICGMIDRSYQTDKISFADNEDLYKLVSLVARGKGIH